MTNIRRTFKAFRSFTLMHFFLMKLFFVVPRYYTTIKMIYMFVVGLVFVTKSSKKKQFLFEEEKLNIPISFGRYCVCLV